MLARILAAFTVIAAGAATAEAQGSDANRDRLKQMLEEKFGAPSKPSGGQTRGLSSPGKIDKDDVFVIKPATPAPGEQAAPQRKGSQLLPGRNVRVAEATVTRGTLVDGVLKLAQASPAQAGEAKAQEAPIVVKRNSFTILLKPDATAEDIDRILTKHKLRVTKSSPSLGTITVERMDEPRGGTRGLRSKQPPSVTGQSGDSLPNIFEPRIVRELRNDPAVDAAFVNQSISPKALPKRSDAKTQSLSGATLRWSWLNGGSDDGNWGLKTLRMPAVWTILNGLRKDNPDQARTRVSLLDSGFGKNRQISYSEIWGGALPPGTPIADCSRSHGTHVSGIIGANFDKGDGIDGMVPGARIEAIPISRELLSDSFNDGITDSAQQHVSFFMDAITDLSDFLDQSTMKPGERRVVNISLAYNWSGVTLTTKSQPTEDRVIRDQVRQHAKVVQSLVNRVQDRVLFVAAAGNDSDGLADPVVAEFASPFAYAGVHQQAGYTTAKNVVIVEAVDRAGARASFSNVGGHVAAPGVDIMSTVASDKAPFAVCSGTSQATPHVTALAAILFEADPTKTPAELSQIIRGSALPPPAPQKGAPRIDALEALLKVKPDAIKYLADLNGDGKVDAADLEIFKTQIIAIEEAKFGAQAITADLNRDGKVDDYERCWPAIDLNGSGRGSYDPADKRMILGQPRSDLEVMQLAWTDTTKPFDVALKDSGLDDFIQAWLATGLVAAVPEEQVAAPCR
jgi:hypothetical protein